MRIRFTLTMACVLAFTAAFAPDVQAYQDEDVQLWNQIAFDVPVGRRWEVHIHQESRFADDVSHYYYDQTDAQFAYEFAPYFALGAGFKYVYAREDRSDWKSEFRPMVNAWLMLPAAGFLIEDRNRFEYRIREADSDKWRYRNRLDINFPYFYKPLELRAYVANEIFIDINGGGFDRDRLYGGIKINPLTQFEINLFYLRNYQKGVQGSAGWRPYNIIGLYFSYLFGGSSEPEPEQSALPDAASFE